MATMVAVHRGWLAPAKAGALTGEETGDRAPFPDEADDGALVAAMATLTRREKEVLRGRAAGLTVGEIADRAFISVSSVKAHLCNAFGKLGLDDVHEKWCRACFLLGCYDELTRGRAVER